MKGKKERIGRLLQMHANEREEIKEVRAGDIAAVVGLKEVITGETISDVKKSITLERMVFPEPVISQARSEEHTSELQSLRHLVCRLLLEKKKKTFWARTSTDCYK